MSLETDIARINNNLRRFEALIEDDRKEVLRFAAAPLVDTIKSATPVGSRVHKRYKKQGKKRSRKGQGQPVAIYNPGNLRGSIKELTKLKRAYNVWVGPSATGGTKGNFGPRRSDGYYAHMVEGGTKYANAQPFFWRSVSVAAPAVRKRIEFGLQVAANKYRPV